VRHKQALHFSTVSHLRVRWLKVLAQFSPQYQRTRHKEGVFQIIGPTKRSIQKGVADGIVAAIRSRERNGLVELPKPPRLKRGDAVRILKGPFAHDVGLYHGMKPHERIEVLLSLLGGSQRVTLPESDVEAAS
jgi:transcription antitermination factor NusG